MIRKKEKENPTAKGKLKVLAKDTVIKGIISCRSWRDPLLKAELTTFSRIPREGRVRARVNMISNLIQYTTLDNI